MIATRKIHGHNEIRYEKSFSHSFITKYESGTANTNDTSNGAQNLLSVNIVTSCKAIYLKDNTVHIRNRKYYIITIIILIQTRRRTSHCKIHSDSDFFDARKAFSSIASDIDIIRKNAENILYVHSMRRIYKMMYLQYYHQGSGQHRDGYHVYECISPILGDKSAFSASIRKEQTPPKIPLLKYI